MQGDLLTEGSPQPVNSRVLSSGMWLEVDVLQAKETFSSWSMDPSWWYYIESVNLSRCYCLSVPVLLGWPLHQQHNTTQPLSTQPNTKKIITKEGTAISSQNALLLLETNHGTSYRQSLLIWPKRLTFPHPLTRLSTAKILFVQTQHVTKSTTWKPQHRRAKSSWITEHSVPPHFRINWQKLSLLEKWNFHVFTFCTYCYTWHMCFLS